MKIMVQTDLLEQKKTWQFFVQIAMYDFAEALRKHWPRLLSYYYVCCFKVIQWSLSVVNYE